MSQDQCVQSQTAVLSQQEKGENGYTWSQETLEKTDSFMEEMRKYYLNQPRQDEDRPSCSQSTVNSDYEMRSGKPQYEIHHFSDSEDPDDEEDSEFELYQKFQEGVNDEGSIKSEPMSICEPIEVQIQLKSLRFNRKRQFNIELSVKLEEITEKLDVIPAKIRRLQDD